MVYAVDRATLIHGMGRQTSVAMSEQDETKFLTFLRADADVRIYRRAAPTPELLLVPSFPPRRHGEWVYLIWNTAFAWKPEYGIWQAAVVQDPQLTGKVYIRNQAGAPVLEYARHAIDNPAPQVYGRIYWNTDFAIRTGPEYDVVAFGRWYDHVIRWVRRNSSRVEVAKNWYQYWLPDAWARRRLQSR